MNIFAISVFFILAGILGGVIFNILDIVKKLSHANLLITIVLDIVGCLLCGTIFIFTIFGLENGSFAFFEILCFAFGLIFEQIFVQNIFASSVKRVYTFIKQRKMKKNDTSKINKLG